LQARDDQILPDLLLPVDDDRAPDQLGEVQSVARGAEAYDWSLVDGTKLIHPFTETSPGWGVDRAVVQHASAD
jgi:hypothetical protein